MASLFYKKPLFVIFIVLLFVGVLTLSSDTVRGTASSLLAPFQAALWRGGAAASGFFEGVFSRTTAVEVEALREENESLKQELALLSGVKEENKRFREVLNITEEEEWNLVFSDIIGKEAGRDILFLNKGRSDGIEEGMPVVNQHRVAVGSVSKVFEHTSQVSSLSLKDRISDVRLFGKDAVGTLHGKGGFEATLGLIPSGVDLVSGDLLVTSTLGGVFPRGLLVGVVASVERTDVSAFQGGEVELFFNLHKEHSLFVITNLSHEE